MKLAIAISVSLLSNFAYAQGTNKSKSPAQSSAEATEEAPNEQGMEDDGMATEPATPDQSSKASGIGLDGKMLRPKTKQIEDPGPQYQSEDLDEAADDILNESFSQPGYDQNTGHTEKKKSGKAKIAVPDVTKPLPSVKLETKPTRKQVEGSDKVIITDKDVILRIQRALVKHGAKLNLDGVMGASTIEALKAFQDDQGLKADGNPSPATLTKLGIIYIHK